MFEQLKLAPLVGRLVHNLGEAQPATGPTSPRRVLAILHQVEALYEVHLAVRSLLRRRRARLRGDRAAALGTAYLAPDGMSADGVIRLCSKFNDAGVQHLIFNMLNVHGLSPLETFGKKTIPAAAEL